MFSLHEIRTTDASHSSFRLKVPSDTKKEDLINSQKYREIVKSNPRNYFKAGDIMEIVPSDHSFFARLMIIGCAKDELFTRVIEFVSFKKATRKDGEAADFDIVWEEKSKYVITRKSDKKMIKNGFSSEEEALYYIKNIY